MPTIFAIPRIALTLHGLHFTSSGYISAIQSFSYPEVPPVTMNGCPLGEASCLKLTFDSKMQGNCQLLEPLQYLLVSMCYPLRLHEQDRAKYGQVLHRTHTEFLGDELFSIIQLFSHEWMGQASHCPIANFMESALTIFLASTRPNLHGKNSQCHLHCRKLPISPLYLVDEK